MPEALCFRVVRPSEAWNALFPPVHGSICPSNQPWLFCGMSVHPSICPSRFLGICHRTHGGNDLTFCMLMYFGHFRNWVVYGLSLLIFFFNFGTILTYWNGSNLGFPSISWTTHWGNGLKFCMLMYHDHLQNWLSYGHSLLIFLILALFWLGHIWGFWPFWSCSVDFPHFTETGHILGFWALSGKHMGVNAEGAEEAYFWCFVSSQS